MPKPVNKSKPQEDTFDLSQIFKTTYDVTQSAKQKYLNQIPENLPDDLGALDVIFNGLREAFLELSRGREQLNDVISEFSRNIQRLAIKRGQLQSIEVEKEPSENDNVLANMTDDVSDNEHGEPDEKYDAKQSKSKDKKSKKESKKDTKKKVDSDDEAESKVVEEKKSKKSTKNKAESDDEAEVKVELKVESNTEVVEEKKSKKDAKKKVDSDDEEDVKEHKNKSKHKEEVEVETTKESKKDKKRNK